MTNLTRVTRKKTEKFLINKIRNKKRNKNGCHRNTKDCKRILWTAIHQQIGQCRINGQFLESYNHPRLNQEEIENLNWLFISTEIESVIKKLFQNKSPVLDGFTGKFYQTFKDDLIRTLLKLSQKIEEKGILPNSFYEAHITWISKWCKDNTQKRKL